MPDDERVVTSAIQEMTVAEVRKSLAQMRRDWVNHSAVQPFYPSDDLVNGMSVAEFAFRFVMGHHQKRHSSARS